MAMGIQNGTVRHFGVPDLTTTVISLTLTGFVAESALVGGTGARPVRRLGSIVAGLVAIGFLTLGKPEHALPPAN